MIINKKKHQGGNEDGHHVCHNINLTVPNKTHHIHIIDEQFVWMYVCLYSMDFNENLALVTGYNLSLNHTCD